MTDLIARFHTLSIGQQILLAIVLGAALLFIVSKVVDKLGREGAGRTFWWVGVLVIVSLFIYLGYLVSLSAAHIVAPSF